MNFHKPELVVSAGSIEEAEKLFAAGADSVNVGTAQYSLRMPGDFSLPMIGEVSRIAHAQGKKIYVSINSLLHHEELGSLEGYMQQLAQYEVDAIVFGDPAVLMTARKAAPSLKLHWNTETTSTNFRTVNFWAKRGASSALLARELSMQEVIGIKEQSQIPIQVQVHGMTCIFHSKRSLVSNYLHLQESGESDDREKEMFLKENSRGGQHYPIFEDRNGTHVMSHEDICMLEHLGTLVQSGINSLYVETLGKPLSYNCRVVSIYREAIDLLSENPEAAQDPAWMEELQAIQPAGRPLGTGFYFRGQVY
ncbi:U32 family peptidase [Brevibacillus ruminantium]|uniref:U32 family peptidase n=1 Tax=Brevibacillus ruminantium TaxID=2950604 RepID=A0ABY4WD92_9BACL|nr:peptidase U32 family protein [Brevibacillus ruminantium]USG65028.1 U32 family peptidase [Brevibacillus ruminantium]